MDDDPEQERLRGSIHASAFLAVAMVGLTILFAVVKGCGWVY